MRYVCPVCGYVYDEEKEGRSFAQLPDSWICPLCGADKSVFIAEVKQEAPEPAAAGKKEAAEPAATAKKEAAEPAAAAKKETPEPAAAAKQKEAAAPACGNEELRQLSAGELSALCSNLARGCEKQYKEEEAALFCELAEYFAAVTPAVPDADIGQLAALIRGDLQEGYPSVRAAAAADADRGAQRACVWGEKVTNILNSLIGRYQKEGDAFLRDTQVWVCTVCGFVFVGDAPPELCPVCKVPAWKFERTEGRVTA